MDHKSTNASTTAATTTSSEIRDNGPVRSRVNNKNSKVVALLQHNVPKLTIHVKQANNTKAIDTPAATKVDSHEEELEQGNDTPHSESLEKSSVITFPPTCLDQRLPLVRQSTHRRLRLWIHRPATVMKEKTQQSILKRAKPQPLDPASPSKVLATQQ